MVNQKNGSSGTNKNKLTVLNIPQPDTIFKSFYENFAYFDKNSIFKRIHKMR